MQIQITLNQNDIEAAIRDFLVKNKMNSPVDTINFTVTRKGGQTIEAGIDLTPDGDRIADTSKEVSEDAEEPEEAPKKAKPVKQSRPEPETEVADEEDTPFTPDQKAEPANEDQASVPEGKSLFG